MSQNRPKVFITFVVDGKNGGPYTSHTRIIKSHLSEKYNFVPFMIENPRNMRKPKTFLKMVKYIKSEKPDFVHLSGLQMEGFLVTLACKIARVKTVVAVRGSSTEAIGFGGIANFIFRCIESFTVRNATAVYGVSDYVSSWKICKKAKHYYGTIYNIADFSKRISEKPYIRKELGISDDDIVITSTGRIIKDKGFDVLWQVMKQLRDYDKVKLVVAGDGAYKKEWQDEIEAEGLTNKVFLLGYRNDIDDILNESDIFTICTKHETLCNSLLEGAMHSLPLVATRVGGIPEIIDDGQNGFLVSLGDVNGFKDALAKLIVDTNLRVDMGEQAKIKIENNFSESTIISKLDELYNYVLGAKK